MNESNRLQNQILICADCEGSFTFTIGEQLYFTSKQLSVPKRCQPCRKKRREAIVPDYQVVRP